MPSTAEMPTSARNRSRKTHFREDGESTANLLPDAMHDGRHRAGRDPPAEFEADVYFDVPAKPRFPLRSV